jgi:hypothetical protein
VVALLCQSIRRLLFTGAPLVLLLSLILCGNAVGCAPADYKKHYLLKKASKKIVIRKNYSGETQKEAD